MALEDLRNVLAAVLRSGPWRGGRVGGAGPRREGAGPGRAGLEEPGRSFPRL